jgi:O2-independent ubiquinone biosynthesis accessory factor UbiT
MEFTSSSSTSSPVRLPAGIARRVLAMSPPQLLSPTLRMLLGNMRRRHPGLFQNLKNLDATSILVAPTDLRWQFLLTFGGGVPATLTPLRHDAPLAARDTTARIKGTLATLFDLLEGTNDGDTLFFSRALTISGDTAAIVALRNTLDRENINLLNDITALCGPFAKPAQRVIARLDRLVMSLRSHHAQGSDDSRRVAALQEACDKLQTENRALSDELAKFKVRAQRQHNGAA